MKRIISRTLSAVAVFAVIAAAFGLAPVRSSAAKANNNPGVIPPQARPFGHTYGEWSNRFWQWAFSIPVHAGNNPNRPIINPLADKTGTTDCAIGQSGHVWFLSGLYNDSGTVTRNCTIPAGTALFFPVSNAENENITWDPHPTYDLYTLSQQLSDYMTSFGGCPSCSATVDGRAITGVFADSDRIGYEYPTYPGTNPPVPQYSAFSINIPRDNLFANFGWPETKAHTEFPVVNDGWYLMLRDGLKTSVCTRCQLDLYASRAVAYAKIASSAALR